MPSHPKIDLVRYELDGIQQFEAQLSSNLPTNPDQSKQIALQRIQQLDEREMPAIQDAAVGLAKAMQTGVDRTPAILFDGEAVVYGLTDLGVALDHYRTWRSGARP
ncbi:MAG: TIGR03757 family integrating conjugative element protein [Gammaproteobacteria bacterium]|nr:TIGR03757 family integrating conjugative element protein [Gammaproteobacteria bacterium]MCB1871760.1 TIGR03757 family integrating conjugative element protein [Gammaproteobacteria bacterium]MCP5408964.1 TIGR03757 family integrating conjugative element protein [Chromatiaceae bacterium]